MPQAAVSFPSHLLPLLAALLALAALALGGLVAPTPRALVGLWRRARRVPPLRAALGTAGLAVGLVAASYALLGPPLPRVTDELSYLLSADTFLHGRLTNPPAPPGGHFTADNVLDLPTRSSRYPPGQGLVLAIGWKLLGVRWGGLLLSAAAVTALTVWMLGAWVAAPWPLVGGLLVAVGPAFGSYWSQSYWGGHVAACGSLLLVGAAGRLRRRASFAAALLLGSGLGILAASRPWEGLAAGVATVGWLILHWIRQPRRRGWRIVGRVLAPTLAGLAPWLLLIALYDRAVTGDPWTMPHRLYRATQGGQPELRFTAPTAGPGEDGDATPVVAGGWFDVGEAAGRFARMAYHVSGLPLTAVALGGLGWSLARRRASGTAPAWRAWGLPLAGLLAVAIAHGLTWPYFPHYSAPAFGCVWALGVGGARRMGVRGRAGATLAVALVAAQLVYSLAELPAHRPDRLDWSRERQRIADQLATAGGRHLLFVAAPGDWVYNGADLVSAPVLWANCLGEESDARLLPLVPGRQVWKVSGADTAGPFRVEPYLRERSPLSSSPDLGAR